MSRLIRYLTDPRVTPRTHTCRLKVWAHDNAYTLSWITAMNTIGWVVTIFQCH